MKISHLQEGSVSGDPAITQNNQQAPRFGRHPTTLEQVSNVPNIGFKSARDPKVLEKQVDEMTAGCVAAVAKPLFTQSRTKTKENSITSGIKSSKKYANSPVNENELSEEHLLAKQLQQDLFKKAKLRDIGKPTKISDVLLKKELEQAMLEQMSMNIVDEDDNDFWYHGPDSIARECYYNTNNPVLTTEDIHHLFDNKPPKHINVINNKPYIEKPDVASILKAHKELVENNEIPVDSNKVFQSMGQQLIQIGSQADKIKRHDPEEIKKAIVNKLNEIDDPRLTHATKTLLQKTVEFNRKHPKVMAAAFGLIFAILARVSMEVSHRLGLTPTQATLIIEATLPTLGNFVGYLVNGFSVKDSIQSGLIAGTIGVAGTMAASSAINEFATGGGSDSSNYFRELASAWYNGAYDSGSLQKGIKTNQDIERLLQRGIVAPDGKTRKYNIDYNSDFDGVIIFSDDYYEHGDHDDTIDSRTGQKWGPYDYMEFSDDELSEGLAEAKAAATASFRAGYKKRAELSAMTPDERRAYDQEQQEKQRKRDDARLERERQKNAAKKGVAEVSDKTLQNYLSRADKQVNNRLSRMGQARERLNKNYEIYDVKNPTRIIDRFEANTPELAREYYSKFIKEYNPGDQDFHFELRRSTGLSEQDLAEQELEEKWSQKYKDSINCNNPKGFSQKAHCAGKKKNNESLEKDLFKADFSKYSTPTLMNFLKTFAKQKNPNTEIQTAISKELLNRANKQQTDKIEKCPHCGGPIFNEMIMNEKKDACYYKVKSRYKVWPSAYASGALVKCRKSHGNWGNGSKANESVEQIEENLHQWFKEKWVRFGPDGKIRGDCARGDDSEGKPKCLPQAKAHSLGKKGRASAASRKRREDPNPERSGKAINVNTKKKSNEGVAEDYESEGHTVKNSLHTIIRVATHLERQINDSEDFAEWESEAIGSIKDQMVKVMDYEISKKEQQGMAEEWSQKYKNSINCSHPKGFSQKAHCAGKKKHNESIEMEAVCPDCGMCETHGSDALAEACWKGYHKEGNKKMFGKTYPNCVKNTNEEQLDEKCWDTYKQVGMKSKGGKMVPNCVPKESVEESQHSESCPHCGGEMVSEELMNEKKDACYYKVKSRYKVWPSAYASGALVKCRKKGASNWGTGGKK